MEENNDIEYENDTEENEIKKIKIKQFLINIIIQKKKMKIHLE